MNQKKEIKKVIEQILGSSITMRDDSTPPKDGLKEEFVNMIKIYQKVWESLINFCFDEGAADAILFYVYSYKDENTPPFIDKNGNEHYFKSIDDLWEFLLYWAEEIMKL